MKSPRRAAKRIKTEPRDGDQFVGKRVAKYFFDDGQSNNGELTKFFGTITRFFSNDDLECWRIDYDDGDSEDMEFKELQHAIALEEDQETPKINKVDDSYTAKGEEKSTNNSEEADESKKPQPKKAGSKKAKAKGKAKTKKGRFVDDQVAKFFKGRGVVYGQVKTHYPAMSDADTDSGNSEEQWRVKYDNGKEEMMELEELLECRRKWRETPKCVIFGHPGIERDAFKGPQNANTGNTIENPLNLELTLKDGNVWRGKGSVFSTPKGDQRFLMQTKAHVINKVGDNPRTKLVRYAAEYAGYATEIARSTDLPATTLDKPWTRVYEPLLCPRYPVEAIIRDNDPLVLTGGEFRYGLCKQFLLKKMRTLPVGSIILFCSMNNRECYLDTVFVVGRCVDVIDEEQYQETKWAKGEASPLDFCNLSSNDFSAHQGADAWEAAIEQGSDVRDSLVTVQQATTLTKLQKDFRKRDPTPRRIAVPPKDGSGPLSGRLYWGQSYDPKNSDKPFSFVPVWEVPKGKESSTEDRLMRPRPKLDFNKLYKSLGCSSKVPKYNAQLTSVPIPMDDIESQKKCFDEILRQVQAQGYKIGVKFSPPKTMSPHLEKKLASLELGEITLCENSFGSSERGIKKGRLITTEDRMDEIWEVQSLHMGPFIRVKNQKSGKIEDWPSIGTKSNIVPARGYK